MSSDTDADGFMLQVHCTKIDVCEQMYTLCVWIRCKRLWQIIDIWRMRTGRSETTTNDHEQEHDHEQERLCTVIYGTWHGSMATVTDNSDAGTNNNDNVFDLNNNNNNIWLEWTKQYRFQWKKNLIFWDMNCSRPKISNIADEFKITYEVEASDQSGENISEWVMITSKTTGQQPQSSSTQTKLTAFCKGLVTFLSQWRADILPRLHFRRSAPFEHLLTCMVCSHRSLNNQFVWSALWVHSCEAWTCTAHSLRFHQ